MEPMSVVIDYTNHRGERSLRTITPHNVRFGSSQWHPEPQWMLEAWDHDRDAHRSFAMADIHEWNVNLCGCCNDTGWVHGEGWSWERDPADYFALHPEEEPRPRGFPLFGDCHWCSNKQMSLTIEHACRACVLNVFAGPKPVA